MICGLSTFHAFAVTVVYIGVSIADEPKNESPEQRREQLRIAVQAICPVSGESLAGYAKAQVHCLVMSDNEVSEKSKLGIIEGHAVFICCPPCIKKLTAAPEKSFAKLDALYEASLRK